MNSNKIQLSFSTCKINFKILVLRLRNTCSHTFCHVFLQYSIFNGNITANSVQKIIMLYMALVTNHDRKVLVNRKIVQGNLTRWDYVKHFIPINNISTKTMSILTKAAIRHGLTPRLRRKCVSDSSLRHRS